jgi:hypothetical protein
MGICAISARRLLMSELEYQIQRMIALSDLLAKDLEWIRAENKRLADEATVLEAELSACGITF